MTVVESRPMVSIIMPVYNSVEFLRDSIDDIIRQAYDDFELICVYDDGTTDGSEELLNKLAEKDARIKVIHHSVRGCNVCRNRGLDEAVGKYLLFLDADDRFESDMLEKSVELAETGDFDVVVFDGDMFDHETGKHRGAPRLIKSKEDPDPEDPFSTVNTTIWNKLFLREFINEHDLRFSIVNNSPTAYFVFMALVYAKRIGVLRSVLVHYRTNNPGSTLGNLDKYPLEAYDELMAIVEKLRYDGRFDEKRGVFAGFAKDYINDRLRVIKTSVGFRELYNALHDGGIEKMDVLDDAYSQDTILREIADKNMDEYLFDIRRRMKESGLLQDDSWLLPLERSTEEKRVVLYGGGNVGQDYFVQMMRRPDIKLVSWVDGAFERIGYPLQSPQVINDLEYDFIVIAVSDSKTANSIIERLESMDVSNEKIYWKKPERI